MEPTVASTSNSRHQKAVRYTTTHNIAAAPRPENNDVLVQGGQGAGQANLRDHESLRTDWKPAVLHRQVKRIWRVLVLALFLLLLATAVHIVQFFVPPANFNCSQHCHCSNNKIVRRLQTVQGPQGEQTQDFTYVRRYLLTTSIKRTWSPRPLQTFTRKERYQQVVGWTATGSSYMPPTYRVSAMSYSQLQRGC